MATKNLGTAPSDPRDADTKGARDTALSALMLVNVLLPSDPDPTLPGVYFRETS